MELFSIRSDTDGRTSFETFRKWSGKPVPNQVQTTPAQTGRQPTYADTIMPLTCRNTTRECQGRRNRQAWHARGQGFGSPKLHQVRGLLRPDHDHRGAK